MVSFVRSSLTAQASTTEMDGAGQAISGASTLAFPYSRTAPAQIISGTVAAQHTMSKTRVLVVDDDPTLSDLVRLFLEKTNRFEVRVENRPTLAVAAAREFRPEMILLDVDMPGKDGGEVAREMKTDSVTRGTPIVFLTSLISKDEAGQRETVRGGMRFLAKPVDPKVLVETVDRVLASQKTKAA